MKRLFVLLAALAATSAIVAGSALAAPYPTTYCSTNMGTSWHEVGNLTVNAGDTCRFWGHVAGTLTVNGRLIMDGSTIDGNTSVGTTGHLWTSNTHFKGNVGVNGGSIQFGNTPSTLDRNLGITNSTGDPNGGGSIDNGFWAPVTIGGNFSYSNNYVPLFGAPTRAANLS
jgi:hypothetical protein